MARLSDGEKAEYLLDIMPYIDSINTSSVAESNELYASLSRRWLLSSEQAHMKVNNTPQQTYVCSECGSLTYILCERSATYTCNDCGVCTQITGPSSSRYMPYDQELQPAPCPYRRSNHFMEWLNAFMARQSSTVPAEVFDAIDAELRKQRVTDRSKLTLSRVRNIMKSLKLNKYYDSTVFIMYKLKGESPPKIGPEIESELISMFSKIQAPFEAAIKQVCPQRKNFLSYSYTIFKFLQLLELDYLLEFFPLLKSREKLAVQDQIWKHICSSIGWRYIPSI